MSEFDILRSEFREMNIQLQDRFDRQLREHREYTNAQFEELKSIILGRPVNTDATPIAIKSSVPIEPFTVRERDEVCLSDNFNEESLENKKLSC